MRFRLNAQAGRLLVACAPDKVVDTGFLAELTPAQLDLFIRVSLDADGSRNNTGTWVMAQKDRHRVEAFQIACALAGLSGGVRGPTRWGAGARFWMLSRFWPPTRATGLLIPAPSPATG